MFDTHCHLDFEAYDADRRVVWERARTAGVGQVLVPGYAPGRWAAAPRALAALEGVFLALGVHPWALAELDGAALADGLAGLGAALVGASAVAVGECGLDGPLVRARGISWELQERVLGAQLDVAAELGLPVVLHVVKAHGRMLALLRERGPLRAGGVLHSYSGPPELVPDYAALDLSFSFSPSLLHPRARRPLAALAAVPDARLLLESDGPDQAPKGASRGEPAHVVQVCARVAALRGQSPAHVAELTTRNACALFRTA